MYKFLLPLIVIIVLISSCKKDSIEKNVSISGNVINYCTNKGCPSVIVSLRINFNGTNSTPPNTTNINTMTDANGNFDFTGQNIHSSNDYSYSIIICAAENYPFGFSENPIPIDKNKLNNIQLGVVPSFTSCTFYLPNNEVINPTDSFSIFLEQKILKGNFPKSACKFGPLNLLSYRKANFSYYPMGWWYITLNKTKNGIRSVTYDSVYLDMNATVIDTLLF